MEFYKIITMNNWLWNNNNNNRLVSITLSAVSFVFEFKFDNFFFQLNCNFQFVQIKRDTGVIYNHMKQFLNVCWRAFQYV